MEAIFICFGLPVFIVFIVFHYRYRMKLLEVQARDGQRQLGPSPEELRHRHELEERLHKLEAVVYSGEFELNQRLNRLPLQHLDSLPKAEALAPDPTAAPRSLPGRGRPPGEDE